MGIKNKKAKKKPISYLHLDKSHFGKLRTLSMISASVFVEQNPKNWTKRFPTSSVDPSWTIRSRSRFKTVSRNSETSYESRSLFSANHWTNASPSQAPKAALCAPPAPWLSASWKRTKGWLEFRRILIFVNTVGVVYMSQKVRTSSWGKFVQH